MWLKSLDSLNISESTSKMHWNSPNTKQLPIETLIGTASNDFWPTCFWQPQTSFPLLIFLPSLSSCLLNFALYITADRCFPRGDKNALTQSLSDSFQAVPHQGSDRWAIRQVGKQFHLTQLQAFLEGKKQSISWLHSVWHYPTICKVYSECSDKE